MAIRTEISLRLQNSPGALGKVCRVLAADRVNIHALSLDAGGTLRLVVDNPLHAAGTLEDEQYAVDRREVLFIQVPNDPGALQSAAGLLAAAGVNVDYLYASALEDSVTASVVAGVEDAQRASMQAGL
ncbi:MAG: amino acid-binding protein [Acidobacteria bacterium]|nr:amino acid-binding protein [Acidobacteriota bacterium]